MTRWVALLRAINVGGHKQVAMADLRDLLTQLGFVDARSLLQSGNLVFRSRARTGAQLERLLEASAAKRLALQTDFFVRTADELKAIVTHNPFSEEGKRDPGHLVVVFLKAAPFRTVSTRCRRPSPARKSSALVGGNSTLCTLTVWAARA
jgi:uncharacterized protein (DUF1697 family)